MICSCGRQELPPGFDLCERCHFDYLENQYYKEMEEKYYAELEQQFLESQKEAE